MKVRIEYKSGKIEVTDKIELKDYSKAVAQLVEEGRLVKIEVIEA